MLLGFKTPIEHTPVAIPHRLHHLFGYHNLLIDGLGDSRGGFVLIGKCGIYGCKKGRSAKKDLKVGICGEHGGEPSSVEFCYHAGMNYVSCSPYRVPIARLAAAQAKIKAEEKGK